MNFRTGIGFDAHPLVEGRELVLGGVSIPFHLGLDGHSDGDALVHAIIDACLGGANLGDIGVHFPSSDPQTRRIRSTRLLAETVGLLADRGWRVEYLDATIVAERPRLRSYVGDMRTALADTFAIDRDLISVKATTTDHLGFVGRGEGICCIVVVTISKV